AGRRRHLAPARSQGDWRSVCNRRKSSPSDRQSLPTISHACAPSSFTVSISRVSPSDRQSLPIPYDLETAVKVIISRPRRFDSFLYYITAYIHSQLAKYWYFPRTRKGLLW